MPYTYLFLISFAGMSLLFGRHYRRVRSLSPEAIKGGLMRTTSVRKEIKELYLYPLRERYRSIYFPAICNLIDRLVLAIRGLLIKAAERLTHISEDLEGKHINLDISEKSEYWRSLGDIKPNKEFDSKDRINSSQAVLAIKNEHAESASRNTFVSPEKPFLKTQPIIDELSAGDNAVRRRGRRPKKISDIKEL